MSIISTQEQLNNYRILYKKQKDSISIALKSAPPPPEYIFRNICCEECNVCHKQWFENTITMFRCQCKQLRLCPMCAAAYNKPACMEHNMVDCNIKDEWDGENVDWDN